VKESKFVNPAVKEKRQKAVIAKTQLKKEKPAYGLLLELQKRNVALLQKLIESQKTVVAKVRAAKDEKAKSAALKLVKDIQDRIKTCKAEVSVVFRTCKPYRELFGTSRREVSFYKKVRRFQEFRESGH